MAGTSIRRGSAPRPAAPRARARKPATPIAARALARLPIAPHRLQRGVTIAIVVAVIAAGIALAQVTGLADAAHEQVNRLASRAGFEVKRVEITGIDRMDELKVYDIVLAQQDRAMTDVDLGAVRESLLDHGWIAEARVARRLPDTLVIDIVERRPAAVWARGGRLSLVDASGVVLETIPESERPELPIIAGEGANRRLVELERLLAEAPALKPQVARAEWVGDRRWNIGFKGGETLLLPEGRGEAADALINFARLDGVNRLLGRGIRRFDFRDPSRAYLTMPPAAPKDADEPAGDKG